VVIRRVWIDDWQMQCCGDPFAIDSTVSWSTFRVTDTAWFGEFLDAEVAASITDYEERHDLGNDRTLERTSGVVRAVDAVFCRYRIVDRVATPIAATGVLEPRSSVDGWEDEDDMGAGRSFVGYLVTLDTEQI
jgi:hypothetical protein